LRNKATDNMFSQLAIKHSIHHLCRATVKGLYMHLFTN